MATGRNPRDPGGAHPTGRSLLSGSTRAGTRYGLSNNAGAAALFTMTPTLGSDRLVSSEIDQVAVLSARFGNADPDRCDRLRTQIRLHDSE
jgi:hypothetical protein